MKETFTLEHYKTMEEVRKHIQEDEGHCVQQVAFSSFHNCLTQINFTKKIIRTNMGVYNGI